MSRRGVGGGTDDINVIERKVTSLSQLMHDESTTEEKRAEASDERAHHTTIFAFPAIMEIRQQRAKVVSLGPYHHKENMRFGDNYKWQVLNVMTRVFQLDTTTFFRNMVRREMELRNCFEEEGEDSYPMDAKEFFQMLLLDGCFVLFVLKCFSGKNRPSFDMSELSPRRIQRLGDDLLYQFINDVKTLLTNLEMYQESVICDLLLMENQIPFSVLEELLHVCPDLREFNRSSVKDLALSCFKYVYPKMNKEKSEPYEEFLHLLDVFHWSRVPKDKYMIDKGLTHQTVPGFCTFHAEDFHRSNIKFRKKTSGSSLDVEIKSSSRKRRYVIKVPAIDVNNYQFSVFESLVTFEARYKRRGFCFNAFVESMANLLGSEKDVKVLQKSGIIPKGTEASDDYVIKFFNQLSRCIKPVALMPHPYDAYKNAVDRVREIVERSEGLQTKCCLRNHRF